MDSCVSKVHRGLLWDHYGYQDREDQDDIIPIIDSAYVLLDFMPPPGVSNGQIVTENLEPKHLVHQSTMGCLELCMFAEGSRHQEEIIVTGMRGRVEGMYALGTSSDSTASPANLITKCSISPREQGVSLPEASTRWAVERQKQTTATGIFL